MSCCRFPVSDLLIPTAELIAPTRYAIARIARYTPQLAPMDFPCVHLVLGTLIGLLTTQKLAHRCRRRQEQLYPSQQHEQMVHCRHLILIVPS